MSDTGTHRNMIYRLLPGSKANARRLAGQAGACRCVWNAMLAQHKDAFEVAKAADEKPPSVSFFSLGKEFTRLRTATPWLSEYSFAVTRYCLKYQADAWMMFFTGDRSVPRFKSRHGTTPSFTIPWDVRIDGDRIAIPKNGHMRIRRKGGNPCPDGKPVQAVVRKEAGNWYVTVCHEVEAEERPDTGVSAGVDMNVRQVAVVDTRGEAEIIPAPDTGRRDAKIRRHRRRLARQRKGSRRRMRTRLRVQRLQRKRANRRGNWQHKTSRRMANRAGTVFVEKLNTRVMTRSARGSVDDPGTNVKAKSGLNREILNTGRHSVENDARLQVRGTDRGQPCIYQPFVQRPQVH